MEDSSMKMILKHILNTSALLLTGIVLAGCSSSDAPIEQPINPTGKYTMTVNASKGSDATTRALTIGGNSGNELIAYWDGTEKVTVKEGATTLGTLTTITPDATDNTKAKLSGTLDKAPSGTSLTLELCSPTYGSQDGTLAYIASNCDYATATTTVTYDNDNKTITGNASFINQQAIVKFTLQNAKGESLAFDNLKVSTTGDITITPASATDVIYAALSGVDNNTVTLTATKGLDTYTCIAKNVTFENGKYYRVTAKMRPEPLTFEWAGEDCTVFFSDYNSTLQYSYDKVNWDDYPTSGITLNSTNPIVYFRGDKATKYGGSGTTTIYCSSSDETADKMGKCKVYGNIMSLIDPDPTKFVTLTKLPGTYVFHNLFNGNTNIINDDTKDIVLPATTLTAYCYYAMFFDCTGLTRAPVLPAPTLTDHCYHAMFSGCSSLAYIKCLATDINATSCTTDWVYNVSSTGNFVKTSSTMTGDKKWETGTYGIPSGWTVNPE